MTGELIIGKVKEVINKLENVQAQLKILHNFKVVFVDSCQSKLISVSHELP